MKLFLPILCLSLFCLPQAYAGQIVGVKHCLKKGEYPGDCQNVKRPKNKSCSIKALSNPFPIVGESFFEGAITIPALRKSQFSFEGFIRSYGRDLYGIGRNNKSLTVEWIASRQKLKSGALKLSFKEFYYRVRSSKKGYYFEYHCVN